MALIDNTYFRNKINIPVGAHSDLPQFITQYEKEVLIGLLGYVLYAEMMAAYAALPGTPLPEKWDKLINGTTYTYAGQTIRWNGLINSDKVSFIAYYVYCRYLEAKQTPYQQVGSVIPKQENSNQADGISNHTSSWNNFVFLYDACMAFLKSYPEDYPLENVTHNYLPLTNIFGI